MNACCFIMLSGLALTACKSAPHRSDFRVGMPRQEVVAKFGEPHSRQSLVKSDSIIMGPIESFWPFVAMGARVDIWSYAIDGGRVELYFVDDSSEVKGTGFAVQGAVY